MKLEFKRAEVSDIDEIHRLVNSAYRGESSRKGWTTEADFLEGQRIDTEGLAELIHSPKSQIILLWNLDDSVRPLLIGCMNLQTEEDHVYIGMITIMPSLQNQKLGRKLLEKAEEITLLELHRNCLKMTVISIRHELIAWYKNRGYHLTDEIVPFPDNIRNGIPKQKLQMIVLEKKLISNSPKEKSL